MLVTEQFCGKCGAPRASDNGEPVTMQSKLASAWLTQQATEKAIASPPANGSSPHTNHERAALPDLQNNLSQQPEITADEFLDSLSLPELRHEDRPQSSHLFSASEGHEMPKALLPEPAVDEPQAEPSSDPLVESRRQERKKDLPFTADADTQDTLESLAATSAPNALMRFWNSRRGDFYLGIAIALVVVVLGWGILSGGGNGGVAASGSATRVKRPAADADLSAFDKFLIAVGLAEAPEAPEYRGNPDIKVWVDLNTALYYCPDSDLYEKTAKGKLTSQRQAQLDQFEPASRKACD
jgi:hypothetical protein